jgi:serine protein kinase
MFNAEYLGNSADVPTVRVVYSEAEAIGIGYYVATNPNPTGAALLVGSINDEKLEGDRLDVAGKAFRLDGEFNVANRGLIEFVEIFKADSHLLTALLGLSQEQLIKMERFGSVYADEIIIAHSNEADFQTFMADPHSEALRDRIIAIQIPYNVRIADEVKIYKDMLERSGLENVHLPPLTLPVMSVFAVLSRLNQPNKPGVSLLDKMRAYDGLMVRGFSQDEVELEKRHYPTEAMKGVSPRYVMNRLSAVASTPGISCISPLMALDSLWRGLSEYLHPQEQSVSGYIALIRDTVEEYSERAVQDVQRAYEDRFEETAADLLSDYLANLETLFSNEPVRDHATGTVREADDREMREMERHAGVAERNRQEFRWEIHQFFKILKRKGVKYDYTSELRMKAAIDGRLFPDRRTLATTLSKPRSATNQVEWARRRGVIHNRLVRSNGYCQQCALDTVEYVIHVLKNRSVLRSPRKEGIEWQWRLDPSLTGTTQEPEESEEEAAPPA